MYVKFYLYLCKPLTSLGVTEIQENKRRRSELCLFNVQHQMIMKTDGIRQVDPAAARTGRAALASVLVATKRIY